MDITCFDRQFSALRHRIAGVYGKVHENLLNLPWIGLDRSQPPVERCDKLYVLANDAAENPGIALDDLIDVEYLGLHDLPAAERQQLPSQRRRFIPRLPNILDS